MKHSMLLLETIISFFIMSLVFYFSTLLYSNILTTQQDEFNQSVSENDLLTTRLFILKQLKDGLLLEVNQQQIRFYAFDTEAFKQGFYSGIINLNQSSSSQAYTPMSQITKLESDTILINNSLLYTLQKSHQDTILVFKDNAPKTLYEHYKIIKNISTISFENNALYFNGNLLQKNVTQFKAQNINQTLHISVCIEMHCQEWRI